MPNEELFTELRNEFKFIGIEPSAVVLHKSCNLCEQYGISAEDFVNNWSAFTLNNRNCMLSLETLGILDRKVLSKETHTKLPSSTPADEISPKLISETASQSPKIVSQTLKNDRKRSRSPDVISTQSGLSEGSQENLTVGDNAQASGPSYSDRKNVGKIIVSYGKWTDYDEYCSNVRVRLFGNYVLENCKYMYETPQAKAAVLRSDAVNCCELLIKRHGQKVSFPHQNATVGNICVCGRVIQLTEGRLNKSTIPLHFMYEKRNAFLEMNVEQAASYQLFPGQVIACTGRLNGALKFTADRLFTKPPLLSSNIPITLSGPIKMVVAAGPFTTIDNFDHEPLQDLLRKVQDERPNVLLLLGPFMTTEHLNADTMPTTCDHFFEQIVETILSHLEDTKIHVVLVSSHKDFHHYPLYPTPPYTLPGWDFMNLHSMPDPCILDIDGITIGVSSTDILMQLAMNECIGGEQDMVSQSGDRFVRLVSHLFDQRSFYPLFPSVDVPVDYTLTSQHAQLPFVPHIMILPSKFFTFVKRVESCVAINPERLTKFKTGGSYARIQIHPPEKSGALPNIACEVIKI